MRLRPFRPTERLSDLLLSRTHWRRTPCFEIANYRHSELLPQKHDGLLEAVHELYKSNCAYLEVSTLCPWRRPTMRSSLISFTALVLSVRAASLQQITDITPNPSNVTFYSYIPASLAVPPPLILALHYCGGTAQAYYTGTQYASLADQHGYILIYPTGKPRLLSIVLMFVIET